LRGQKKVTQEKAVPVHRHFVVSLCCSPRKAAVELALAIKNMTRAQTVLADCPFLGCDCSAVHRGPSVTRCCGAGDRRCGKVRICSGSALLVDPQSSIRYAIMHFT